MILGLVQSLVQGTSLQRYQGSLEKKLGPAKISQLMSDESLDETLKSVGMSHDEVREFKDILRKHGLTSDWKNNQQNQLSQSIRRDHLSQLQSRSWNDQRNKKLRLSLPQRHTSGTASLPSSPGVFEVFEGDGSVRRSLVSSRSVEGSGSSAKMDEPNKERHSESCPCERCCKERNEEYVVWHKVDEIVGQPTSTSTPTTPADKSRPPIDFKFKMDEIYHSFPNKFDLPNGKPADIRMMISSDSWDSPRYFAPKTPDGLDSSFTNSEHSTESERTPSKTGTLSKFWLPNKIRSSKGSVSSSSSASESGRSKPSFSRQKSTEEKAKSSPSSHYSFKNQPLQKIQEVFAFGKKKNKYNLQIVPPESPDDSYSLDEIDDLNIKPMSSNAEKLMKETFEELIKCRQTYSPKNPAAGKNPKDSPNSSSAFKFPYPKTPSVVASLSMNRKNNKPRYRPNQYTTNDKAKANDQGKGSKDSVSFVPEKNESVDKSRHSTGGETSRLSAASSSSSCAEVHWTGKFPGKIKSRLARRTVSESCQSHCGRFTPYLVDVLSLSGLKTSFMKSRSTTSSVSDHEEIFKKLNFGSSFSVEKSIKPRADKAVGKQLSLDERPTEFVIRFESSLSLNSVSQASGGQTSGYCQRKETSNSSGSDGTVVPEDFKKLGNSCVSQTSQQKEQNSTVLPRDKSPPPPLPPRAPIMHSSSRGSHSQNNTCHSCRKQLESKDFSQGTLALKKRSFSDRDSTGSLTWQSSATVHRESVASGSPPEASNYLPQQVSDERSSHFDHPAVIALPCRKSTPKIVNNQKPSLTTFKSCEFLPRKPSALKPVPADYRYSADATTYLPIKVSANSSKGSYRLSNEAGSEEDVTISSSSTDCELEESVSYEDMMELALDTSRKSSDVKLLSSLFNNNIPLKDCEKILSESNWCISEARRRVESHYHYATIDSVATGYSPRSKAVVVGNF